MALVAWRESGEKGAGRNGEDLSKSKLMLAPTIRPAIQTTSPAPAAPPPP
jgi:hypothetical protein